MTSVAVLEGSGSIGLAKANWVSERSKKSRLGDLWLEEVPI